MKHNNQLPNQHFRKDWQLRVKTWFDQPGRKKSRRIARIQKASLVLPRPVDGHLRPAVRCPTIKYNTKLRHGRGFTLEELKERWKGGLKLQRGGTERSANRSLETGTTAVYNIVLCMIRRRRMSNNFCEEMLANSLESGIRRKEALSIGIAVDHRRRNNSVESLQLNVQRLKTYKSKLIVFPRRTGRPREGDGDAADLATAVQFHGKIVPIEQPAQDVEARAITAKDKSVNAYAQLRKARSDFRLRGVREKRAKDKAEEEANKVRGIFQWVCGFEVACTADY
ncbi:50S ribosomal protein L13e [Jimgerdemannia flammicorona]|uniref:50S ribosomal protein L13e n=1 Tax=Jimgerdemannia flammicorona TaxID=994334 RepID=A0A433QX33_9FUNG|nr:50S ribosomal protein L13e [Jimgerdemannia flammicorona]